MLDVLKRCGVIACINLMLCGPVALAQEVQPEELTSGIATLPMLGLLFDAPAVENRRYQILGYWDGTPETSDYRDIINIYDTRGDVFLSRTTIAVDRTNGNNTCEDIAADAVSEQRWTRKVSFWGNDWTLRQREAVHPTTRQAIPTVSACREIEANHFLYISHDMSFEALGLSPEEGETLGALNVAPEDVIRQFIETGIAEAANKAVNTQPDPGIKSLTYPSTYINGDRSAAARTVTIPGLNEELQLPDDGYLWYTVTRDGRPYLTRWLPVFPKIDIEVVYDVGGDCDVVIDMNLPNPIDVPPGLPGEWFGKATDEGDLVRTVACRRVDSGSLSVVITMPYDKLHVRDLEPILNALAEALN